MPVRATMRALRRAGGGARWRRGSTDESRALPFAAGVSYSSTANFGSARVVVDPHVRGRRSGSFVVADEGHRPMIKPPSFEDIFAVMAAASVGDMTPRVVVAESPQLDDVATRLGIALNVLLDD